MVVEKDEKSSKLIDVVDKELHDSIIRLTQKLKGLQAEVAVKLESIDEADNNATKLKEVFTLASAEITKVLDRIKDTADMVLAEGVTEQEFLQANQKNIENLRDLCTTNLGKISKLQELL